LLHRAKRIIGKVTRQLVGLVKRCKATEKSVTIKKTTCTKNSRGVLKLLRW
jgi:hypothetical protein